MIAVSTLLKSCAMPPASWPIACIFWLWAKFSCSVALLGGVEREDDRARASSPLCGSAAETKKRAERGGSPSSAASTGAMSPLPSLAAASAARSAAWSRSATPAIDRGPRFAGPRLQRRAARAARRRRWTRSTPPSASTDAIAIGVELKKRGEAHFGGAQILAGVARPAPVERPACATGRAGRRWRRRRGAAAAPAGSWPLAALEVDVELLGRHLAGAAGDDAEQRRAVGGDDVGEFELAGGELGES